MNHIAVCCSESLNPYENLALEQYLLEHIADGQCILYLWQNQNTVVIGKNQNAWAECRVSSLQADGGYLARRLSGGGAVFHDIGNLNFTFLVPEAQYDLDKQLEVICEACLYAGIRVERSGRNDLLAGGRKFSGNAFYHAGGKAYHHGTLLLDVDTEKLQKYLSPPKAKLQSKGVSSVRSRVINLKELCPDMTCDRMKRNLIRAFAKVYGCEPETMPVPSKEVIAPIAAKISSWEYLFGSPLAFTLQCRQYFPWGTVELQLLSKNGVVEDVRVFTDSMDFTLPDILHDALLGCRFSPQDLQQAVNATALPSEIRKDICELLAAQSL